MFLSFIFFLYRTFTFFNRFRSLIAAVFLFFFFSMPAFSQVESDFSAGGAVRVGDSTSTCDGTSSGAIRFDDDGGDTLDYCNGTAWLSLLSSSVSGVINNGNSFGAAMVIGTNDTQSLALETDGSTRVTIDTSGNVGIGTTVPSSKFDVHISDTAAYSTSLGIGAVSSFPLVLQNENAGANFGGLQIRSGASSIAAANISILGDVTGADTSALTFGIRDNSMSINEWMRIRSDGNVGIGTTVPGSILDINGAETMRGIAAPAVSPAGQGRIYFDSTSNRYRVSENNGAYTDLLGGGSGDFLADGSIPMTGELELLSENSATDPDLTFNGDENTGLFQPAPDEIAFSTAGTEALRINSSGYVGIGTSTPAQELHVEGNILSRGNSGGEHTIHVENTSTAFGLSLGVTASEDGLIRVEGPRDLEIQTDSVTRMAIDSSGNVGIGTTTPGSILDISGAESMRGIAAPAVSPAGQGRIYFDSTANKYRVSENGGAYSDLVGGGGGGSGDFLADGSVAMTGQFDSILGAVGAPGISFDGDSDTGFYSPAANNVAITSGGAERMRFDSFGAVGIGTNNPAQTLELYSTATILELKDSNSLVSSNNLSTYIDMRDSSNWPAGYLGFKSGDGVDDLLIGVHGNGNGAMLRFDTEGVTRMVIDDSGNIGMGTIAPTSALEIMGTANDGTLSLTNNYTDSTSKASTIVSKHYTNAEEPLTMLYAQSGISNGSISIGGGNSNLNAAESVNFYTAANNTTLSGTLRMTINSSGDVGIGTATPQEDFHVRGKMQLDADHFNATGSETFLDMQRYVNNSLTHTGTYRAIHNKIPIIGAGDVNAIIGFDTDIAAAAVSTRTMSSVTAIKGKNSITADGGSTTNAIGLHGEIYTHDFGDPVHNITNAKAVYGLIDNAGDGTYTNGFGVESSIAARNGATVTNAYNFYASNTTSAGTITNAYGLYISDLSGTQTYGVYQAGADDLNYFAGNVGIGTATPNQKLHVQGKIAVTGSAPTLSGCGTTPSITGNDTRGQVTTGTGSPASCTITFNSAYNSSPICVITAVMTSGAVRITSTSTTTLVINFPVPTNNYIFNYICFE